MKLDIMQYTHFISTWLSITQKRVFPVRIDEGCYELGHFNEKEYRMNKFAWLLVLLLVSADSRGDWAIKGEGNFSCPDYVSAKQSNGAKLYSSISWVQGFISGVNYQSALEQGSDSVLGQNFPAVSVVNWIQTYCRANPQDYLSDAAEALVLELKEMD
jgi:hypothetical protein